MGIPCSGRIKCERAGDGYPPTIFSLHNNNSIPGTFDLKNNAHHNIIYFSENSSSTLIFYFLKEESLFTICRYLDNTISK